MSNNNPIDAQLALIYLDSGTINPSVTPTSGTKGTLFIQVSGVGAPQLFQKQDEGNTTNWTLVGTQGGTGAPSLPVNSVQFNDAGVFGGSSNFTFNKITFNFILGNSANIVGSFGSMVIGGRDSVGGSQPNTSNGASSFAGGTSCVSSGDKSFSFGSLNTASATDSLAHGFSTTASGSAATSSGQQTVAFGPNSTAQGYQTKAQGSASHAEGQSTSPGVTGLASGIAAHSEGLDTIASGNYSHAEGWQPVASGIAAHAEGYRTQATGNQSHAEGSGNPFISKGIASGINSHTEGSNCNASNFAAHAEGINAIASGSSSHAEGGNATASGDQSHAEGLGTTAGAIAAHAEGKNTVANADNAHAEGESTQATALSAHAEGFQTLASGNYSHAEGQSTNISTTGKAQGIASHCEGLDGLAFGDYSHAEGNTTQAIHQQSHAGGLNTKTGRNSQTVIGEWNTGAADTLFEVGNGTGLGTEADAFAVSDTGEAIIQKEIYSPATLQTLGAAFTISYIKTNTKIDSAADVTSSAVTAITAGTKEGQLILLDNRGSFNITLKNGAGTELPGGLDYILGPKGIMQLIWTGSNWRCIGTVAN